MGIELISIDEIITDYIGEYNAQCKDPAEHIKGYLSPLVCDRLSAPSALMIQPAAKVIVDKQGGLYSQPTIATKMQEFLHHATEKKVSLVLTPEYSVPLGVIAELLEHQDRVKEGTMFCLCCEGISVNTLIEFCESIEGKGAYVDDKRLITLSDKICSCLMYIVNVSLLTEKKKRRKIFVFPQLKTVPMKDPHMEFEATSLTFGNWVYYFGKKDERKFFSLICSDALNYTLVSKLKEHVADSEFLAFNPQMNSKPYNDYFRLMRLMLLGYMRSDQAKIISLNWSCGLELQLVEGDKQTQKIIKHSWSGVFSAFDKSEFEKYKYVLKKYAKYGLNFAHDHRVASVYFTSKESVFEVVIGGNSGMPSTAADVNETYPIAVYGNYKISGNQLLTQEYSFCQEMIGRRIKENRHFKKLINCTGCLEGKRSDCGIFKVNSFMASLLEGRNEDEYELINNGMVSSVVAKDYGSKYSKEKYYVCLIVTACLERKIVTEKFACIEYDFDYEVEYNENGITANVIIKPEGDSETVSTRVVFLQYADDKVAKEALSRLVVNVKKENIIIYYIDESGCIKCYNDDICKSITECDIENSMSSII